MTNPTYNLKKIIGSLLIVGFEGTQITDSLKNFLQQWNLGGVILFKRNIENPEQVLALNKNIHQLSQVTPIISVDHEGGRVFRLPPPFTPFPPMRKIGDYCSANDNYSFAEDVGKVFGMELSAVGFNLDYAPVLDVDSNPDNPIIGDRAFSSDPQVVAKSALALAKGLGAEKILSCGKHFPGHGDTSEDSHLTLPVVEKTLQELQACELVPFRQAVQFGIPALMTAHVMYPKLDQEWPATLSEKILTDLLKRKLGFEGLILSDDMFMQGIVAKWGIEDAAEQFFRAGGDMVLLCHQEAAQRRVAAHLVHRAEQDGDFKRLLEEKSMRVSKLRNQLEPLVSADRLSKLGQEEHQRIARLFHPR